MTVPSVGRIVHYKLTDSDAKLIDQKQPLDSPPQRNPVRPGQVYPAMVVAVFGNGDHANLQVFLDGETSYWACSRAEGDQPGFWSWPPRA